MPAFLEPSLTVNKSKPAGMVQGQYRIPTPPYALQVVCEVYCTHSNIACPSHVLVSLVLYKMADSQVEVGACCAVHLGCPTARSL
jgi:hypothetical protein